MGLEMNMIGFVGMSCRAGDGRRVESLYRYYFIQRISSGMILIMMYIGGLLRLVIRIRIGGGPFYFWFPSVIVGLTWRIGFLLMTFQKVLPVFLISGIGGREV